MEIPIEAKRWLYETQLMRRKRLLKEGNIIVSEFFKNIPEIIVEQLKWVILSNLYKYIYLDD
jgi:hypothetical protein